MLAQADILKYLEEHKTDFHKQFKITKIGLFGSFARNEQTEGSDVDILVEFAPETSDLFEKKRRLKNLLQNVFDREVDICREKYIKPIFREQILRQAVYV